MCDAAARANAAAAVAVPVAPTIDVRGVMLVEEVEEVARTVGGDVA